MRNAIWPAENLRDIACRGRPIGADVGALIGQRVAAQRADGPVFVAGDFQLAFCLAGMIGGGEMLAAVLDPFDWPAGEAGRERNQKILRVEFTARAEAAADVVFHHPDRALGQVHLLRQNAPVEEGDLGRAVHREATAGGIPFRKQAARLHGHRGVPLDRKRLAVHVRRVLEGARRVAAHAGERERAVAPRGVEQQAMIARGGGAARDRRQWLDGERDRIEGVLCGAGRLRQHDRDRLAHVAHLVVGDHGLLERPERRGRILPQRNGGDGGADLGRRDDAVHARP